ncbi:MAG: ribonuclease III [Rugosibacter sp.]|nr:ribonuclease III [Rugosibacter sp.]
MKLLHVFEAALGYKFSRPELLRQALTHRSFGTPHNERLEFLGDSLLNCVIAGALFLRFSELKEGDLSRVRASLVRQETLAEIALTLHLGDYLCLGDGEMKSSGFRRPSTLADALEAVFAAIYLDAGFDAVRGVIEQLYQPFIAHIDPAHSGKDPKTTLQELLQARRLPVPRYELLATHGEAHAQEFEVECIIAALGIRRVGMGNSRRIAEQQAANLALSEIK